MTATEMYEAFKAEMNISANQQLRSWEVAYWLNEAQTILFNEIFYPDHTEKSAYSPPLNTFQNTLFDAEMLRRFEKHVETDTSKKGFLADPDDLARYTAVMIVRDEETCEDKGIPREVPVDYVRDTEFASRFNNRFTRPTWDDARPMMAYRPAYRFESGLNDSSVHGIRVYPSQKYRVRVEYVSMPTPIAIKNPLYEANNWSSNPQYISVAQDVNSDFPPDKHSEIVQIAVAQYLKSRPDYTGWKNETSAIKDGQ